MTARKDWLGSISGEVAFTPDLPLAAKAVYMVLAMYRNTDDDSCFPSNATLARCTGLSERSVQRALISLTKYGVIDREPRFVEGRQTTSVTVLKDIRSSRL